MVGHVMALAGTAVGDPKTTSQRPHRESRGIWERSDKGPGPRVGEADSHS